MKDRREAMRAYKETARPLGVCRVHNRVNGRSFLIASVNTDAMLNRQRFQLEMGGHPCSELQLDWTQQDAADFTFDVVDTIEPLDDPAYDPSQDLDALMTLWRTRLEATGPRCYPAVGARRGSP